mmetsp:Transcript_38478/g.70939  ORF Transcript_38478/g.70939 Transcript_38478/m.70939 type:complete len:329 (+) Transcript_38478:230-1216(+)|eukprot:CAMPEP_0196133166 /NCGR_PEP_ID=MMETSP0910-20130528/2497_1 /TAXON_ID=49265 /ORGANISM="Thalassiosira rotula, Strain GSO102" /LENGTH=328 /DNA_ID=CAMNT_0041392861 /DNA_START=227 /DNA_END=1213 /DNA_ORIENTATION=+
MTDKHTEADVLLGRGVATTRHPGNQRFRSIVSQHCELYATSTKKQKMIISRSIVAKIQTEGKFLVKEANTGLWHEVDDRRALEKTAQALRDGAAPLRKRLLEDMSDPAFLDTLLDTNSSVKPSLSQPRKQMSDVKQEKKHRRTKSDPLKTNIASSPDSVDQPHSKKQRVVLDVERSTSAPIQGNKVYMNEIHHSPIVASRRQQHESAEQHHLTYLRRQPSLQMFETSEDSIAFSKALTPGLADDYEPLPFNPLHGETETAISMDDSLQAMELLYDTGILPPVRQQTMADQYVQVKVTSGSETFLKMVGVDDDWRDVLSEWQSDCNLDR